ncbi:MAG: four helix bundle protein [Gemmatimonadetes bacterium]|nr:four helix bundle protein [Gemmatimonadota bacterium]
MPRARDFRELRVYRAAYDAAMRIFELSRGFPDDERFSLTSQIRRCSRSAAANIAEAWRKRRYPAAFIAKLSDAEAEAAETRAHLDFALGCGYIDRPAWLQLDRRYERLTRQLVRMIATAEEWTPGRASGRSAGSARVTPTPPRLEAGTEEPEDSPATRTAGDPPPLARKKPGNERSPGKEDCP